MAVPIGTNRLLTYLENRGEDAFVRPWVWILWLGLGPIADALCFQYYIFLSVSTTCPVLSDYAYVEIQTGSVTRIESIITSLVFDHALRIRLKAETAKEKAVEESPVMTPPSTNVQGTTTPDNVSEDSDDQTVHSHTAANASNDTVNTAAMSSTATAAAPKSPAKGKDIKAGKDTEKVDKDSKKGKNLAGKLNNLVTSDLGNITDGRDFLFAGGFVVPESRYVSPDLFSTVLSAPLLSVLSMWFLYKVLGWRCVFRCYCRRRNTVYMFCQQFVCWLRGHGHPHTGANMGRHSHEFSAETEDEISNIELPSTNGDALTCGMIDRFPCTKCYGRLVLVCFHECMII